MPDTPSPEIVLIAVGVIRDGDRVLLVKQYRNPDPHPTWALPGGKVEQSETVADALAREIREETGLVVKATGCILGVTHAIESASRQHIIFILEVVAWEGELQPADPDGVILDAEFVPEEEAISRLQTIPWLYMRDPSIAAVRRVQPQGSLWLYKTTTDNRQPTQ